MASEGGDGVVISRGWLAMAGTIGAVIMALGSWGVSQTTARSTQSLQIEQLERRLDGMEQRTEQRRQGVEQAWRGNDERMQAMSDRLARVEARLDSRAELPAPRGRTGFEPGAEDDRLVLPKHSAEPAVIRGVEARP